MAYFNRAASNIVPLFLPREKCILLTCCPLRNSLPGGCCLLPGIIFFSVGILAFIDPLNGYLKLVKFTGIALLLNGGILLTIVIVNTKYPKEKNWMQAESIVHLFFGILFLLNPLLGFYRTALFHRLLDAGGRCL